MFYLKIIVQLIIGVSALLAVLLDYKWYDKRRTVFKQVRNGLIGLSIISLIAGVIITISDERDKNNEIKILQDNLNTAQNTLSYIKSNGDILNAQIKPFIDLAIRRYPNLSLQEALDSLKFNILNIDKKTLILEHNDSLRRMNESKFSKLKKTPPSITAMLLMDEKRNIYLKFEILNNVPINLAYSLVHSTKQKTLNTSGSSFSEVYPSKTNKSVLSKDQFNFPDHIPTDENSFIKLIITYESVYLKESGDPNLRKNLIKYYVIDPVKNSLTDANFL